MSLRYLGLVKGLVVALAVSIGANIYLFVRHADPPATQAVPPAIAAVAPACPPPVAPSPVVIDAAIPPVVPHAAVCPPAPRADCSAVEKKLAETEAKLEEHLPANERYKHAARSLDVETRAAAVLDPIFAALSKAPHAYDVECHGNVCKLEVERSIPREAWMEAVQSHGGFTGWSFMGSQTYATMGSTSETAQSLLMADIGRALNPDAGLAECTGGQPAPGTLTLDVSLDPATRRLNVSATGSLANEHVGSCVRTHVQAALDTIKAPSDVTTFDMPIPLLH